MLSLSEKAIFRLHSVEVLPTEAKGEHVSRCGSSQMDAIKEILQASHAGSICLSLKPLTTMTALVE